MTPVELGYAAAWRLIRMLPRPAAAALFRVGADRAHRRGAAAVRRLAANLRRVVGPDLPAAEFDQLTRDAVRSYARYWMEMFRLPSQSRQQRLAGFHLAGSEMLAANVAAGRGSVVALPHAGNWDAAGAWVAANGWPLTTVAERLRPEGVYERFVAVRQRLGMEIIPATGGPRAPFDVLLDRLDAGHVVPLLADRDLSARGVEVTFFGGRTRMPAGPALLALRTGAPLYVTTMWFEPDRAHGALDGPVPLPDPSAGPLDVRVRLLTQQIADRLAVGIARHPQDWHMMQRLWLDERPGPDPATHSGSAATGPG